MKYFRRNEERGVALVTTVIIVAVLAVVAVAFMQSTSTDRLSSRTVANYYRAQLAAQAGLAEAISLMSQEITDFSYLTGAEPLGAGGDESDSMGNNARYRTFIRALDGSTGTWQFASGGPRYLVSVATNTDGAITNTTAEIVVSGTEANPEVVQTADWKVLEPAPGDSTNQTTRYAFWVDEAGSKQNLKWWDGGGARGLITNLADVPMVLPGAGGATETFPVGSLNGVRSYDLARLSNSLGTVDTLVSTSDRLLTPATVNVMDPALGGRVDNYHFTLSSPSAAVSPLGAPKLNLAALGKYVSSLNTAQGAGSPRALLVEELLEETSLDAPLWGGGNLNWLAKSGKYSAAEQRQIVANLIDYLDEDLIPTTDNINNPTFFGVEMKADASGRIIGHPFINFITIGMIFNRSPAGEVNSTRLICSLGLVYPWSSTGVAAAAYEPEINIEVQGNVLNGIPEIGGEAGAYFQRNDFNGELTSRPISRFTPRTGNNWPQSVGLAGTASYSHGPAPLGYYGFTTGAWPSRGPTNMTFENARYVINKLRLKYTPTDGSSAGYVQLLPTNMTIDVSPPTLVAGGSRGALLVKFSSGGPYATTPNLYLTRDPRASFARASWTNLPSVTSFGTSIPAPSAGASALTLDNGVGPDWDEAQGLPMNFDWYKSASVENHLNRFPSTSFSSIGEVGYLWTGKPWQTLNLTNTDSPDSADWNLLDYLTAGRYVDEAGAAAGPEATAVPVLPLSLVSLSNNVSWSNTLVAQGGMNINSRKRTTWQAVLSNAPGVLASAVDTVLEQPAGALPSAYGSLAALASATNPIALNATTKFGAEAVQRALANVAVNQSRVFTVYALGEYRSGNSSSRALLEADVFVGVDPETGTPRLQVIRQSYR